MRSSRFACFFLGVWLGVTPLQSQNVDMAHPPQMTVQHHPTAEEIRDRNANVLFHKDVAELAELCAAASHDMELLKQGALGKDAVERLKKMEKLSKRVREQLQNYSTAP